MGSKMSHDLYLLILQLYFLHNSILGSYCIFEADKLFVYFEIVTIYLITCAILVLQNFLRNFTGENFRYWFTTCWNQLFFKMACSKSTLFFQRPSMILLGLVIVLASSGTSLLAQGSPIPNDTNYEAKFNDAVKTTDDFITRTKNTITGKVEPK